MCGICADKSKRVCSLPHALLTAITEEGSIGVNKCGNV